MGKQTDRYESASKAYQNALNKYAGEEGWKLALKQGKDYATTAGDIGRSSGYKAARTAGYGKAASYMLIGNYLWVKTYFESCFSHPVMNLIIFCSDKILIKSPYGVKHLSSICPMKH